MASGIFFCAVKIMPRKNRPLASLGREVSQRLIWLRASSFCPRLNKRVASWNGLLRLGVGGLKLKYSVALLMGAVAAGGAMNGGVCASTYRLPVKQ